MGNFYAFSEFYEIEGIHKFCKGDNIQWSMPAFNDSDWGEIKSKQDMAFHGIKTLDGIIWHRFHFRGESLKNLAHSGIYLGCIGDADEVFLNGVKIGSEGSIGDSFIEATHVKRLYRIPENLLKTDDENILAVRVMNTYLKGELFEMKPIIGDFRDLLIEKKLADQRHKNMEIAFLTFMGLFLAFCILAFISGMRQREYISFGVFSFVYSLLYFLDTSVFFDTGLKDHTIQKFIFFLTSLLAPCFLVFSIETFREKYNFFVKLIIFASFVLSFFFLITMEWKIYRIFVYAWTLMAFITGGLVIYNIIKSIIRRTYAAPELIVIISLLTFAGITWAGEVSGLFSTQRIIGFNMSEFAFPLAMILFLYTICAKFSKTLKELKVFSDRILSTHEIERKRISRDLHDSIGQSLSAIKLRLQMLNSKVSEEKTQEKDTYRALIDNISSSIEELRNIAMDIRPSFIETVDLSEALKLHGERFYKQTGIKLHLEVTSQSSKDLSTRIRDNLYRIYQESLNNISKHSEADNVWVSLKDEGDVIILMIEDNGKGFEPLTTCKGIGLETMKERASLLNGDLEIKSSLSKGTKIKVMVPLK